MTRDLIEGARLVSPLFVGFFLHGVCIRLDLLGWLAKPVDNGAYLRGRRLFGDNKTYRGIVCVAVGTALGFLILSWATGSYASAESSLVLGPRVGILGFAVGAVAMLSELPNSALKRQLDIRPGAQSSGFRGALFHVLDQLDVLVGAWLVLCPFVQVTAGMLLGSAIFMYLGHQAITLLGYLLGMRAGAR
jgi:CDP-2,3-bis-(O-geranylgeranyl)-sn-glycerol synthase